MVNAVHDACLKLKGGYFRKAYHIVLRFFLCDIQLSYLLNRNEYVDPFGAFDNKTRLLKHRNLVITQFFQLKNSRLHIFIDNSAIKSL